MKVSSRNEKFRCDPCLKGYFEPNERGYPRIFG